MQTILLVLIFAYWEIIFGVSTGEGTPNSLWMINLLFAFSYGLLVYGVIKYLKNGRVKKSIYGAILGITPVVYYAEYLIHENFDVFYDINTCINGAGGAITEFWKDISRLILCYEGITRLLLFWAPFILYILVLLKGNLINNTKQRLISKYPDSRIWNWGKSKVSIKGWCYVLLAILIYLLSLFMILGNEIGVSVYRDEYNYQVAVEKLGLMTALRLDVKNIIFANNVDFDIAVNTDGIEKAESDNSTDSLKAAQENLGESDSRQSAQDEEYSEQSVENQQDKDVTDKEAEQEYGKNVLDIDFEALADTASGTNRQLDLYVNSLNPSSKNKYTGIFKGKNLIFITAEAFSGYMVDPVRTPTLHRLIHKGIYCEDYYQPAVAGTTGGEYNNLFGLLATSGGKSIWKMTSGNDFITMGHQLDRLGYWGKAYHNNSSTVYSRDYTHNRLGYSQGFEGVGDGMEKYLSSDGFPASDLEMIEGTIDEYINHQPFNIYYMTVSGHGQYGRSINRMSQKNWDVVKDLPYSDKVRAYIANNMELEYALTYLVERLEEEGIADDTVICLSPDHFPYGLDQGSQIGGLTNLSELYGLNVETYLQRDKTSCIIWCGSLEKEPPIVVSDPTYSLDLLPTLCNLFGVEFDSRLYPGRDILSDAEPIIFNGGYDWKTDKGTYIASKNKFIPASENIDIPEDYVSRIRGIVKNKYSFCKGVLADDYYGHVYSAIYKDTE